MRIAVIGADAMSAPTHEAMVAPAHAIEGLPDFESIKKTAPKTGAV